MVRWKRGIAGQGVRQALAYAQGGSCDAHLEPTHLADGVEAAVAYAARRSYRYVVEGDAIHVDALNADQLASWIDGLDPETKVPRGKRNESPDADLLLDAAINAPKTFSIAALLDPDLSTAFDALQDRIRDRAIGLWRQELNARRGHAGAIREDLARIEVVELRHERSRSLDPHRHRHLWLNVKVQGTDGRWSNVDSRVAFRFQNVVNAEGEFAARTDPEWRAALANKGYTIDENGEIGELTDLVRPLSRRANQIEANRALRLARWREQHPGLAPTPRDLNAIDQWAWSYERPGKPAAVDEVEWRRTVLDEILQLAPDAMGARTRSAIAAVDPDDLDLAFLARVAVNNADRRSAGSGGRFSVFDVRAGALRALSSSGIVTDRVDCERLLAEITRRVVAEHVHDLLPSGAVTPSHVKSLMAASTVRVKNDLAATLARLSHAGSPLAEHLLHAAVTRSHSEQTLDPGQRAAAAAVAGTDRLVTVVGPAGAGKTTMLQVAVASLRSEGRSCVLVAPTRKAAGVVGRETKSPASSLHSLLIDYGWIYGEDKAGALVWRQLQRGEIRPGGRPYMGPTRHTLRPGDRIVIDEAGMVDLHAARALAIVAEQTGAGIAMIGDPRQIAPVGHYGAMALVRNASTRNALLDEVHRFRRGDGSPDDEYAAMSLELREPRDQAHAHVIAERVLDGGHVLSVDSPAAARLTMAERYRDARAAGQSLALILATNDEAQAVNELIQRDRITRGELAATRAAEGRDGQILYVGDVVQTRRNDRDEAVENRQQWVIQRIRRDGGIDILTTDGSDRRRTVSARYARNDLHLAYATTAHGAQGETSDAAIVAFDVNAGGLYVGLTRGRTSNLYITTKQSREAIVNELAETMMRGLGENTLDENRDAAQRDLAASARPSNAAKPAYAPDSDASEISEEELLVILENDLEQGQGQQSEPRRPADESSPVVSGGGRTVSTPGR